MGLIIIIFLLGLLASIVGSLVGLGGGVFIVPGLLFLDTQFPSLSYITPQLAVGTSLAVIAFASASSTYYYSRLGKVDFKSGFFFFSASGPGSVIGAYFTTGISEQTFRLIFGSILLLIFYFLIKNKKMKVQNIRWHVSREYRDKQGNVYEYGYHRYLAFAICFIIGVLQGLLGVGGGVFLVPLLILLFWYPPQIAIPTSTFVILLSSGTGSISHMLMNNIDWNMLIWLALGALIGGQVGAYISQRISGKYVTILLRTIILLLAVHALWQGINL